MQIPAVPCTATHAAPLHVCMHRRGLRALAAHRSDGKRSCLRDSSRQQEAHALDLEGHAASGQLREGTHGKHLIMCRMPHELMCCGCSCPVALAWPGWLLDSFAVRNATRGSEPRNVMVACAMRATITRSFTPRTTMCLWGPARFLRETYDI